MKTKSLLPFLAVCSLLFAICNIVIAQNNNQQLGPLWDKDQQNKNIFQNTNYNNVGIGTITPAEKLHVKGNLKVEGKLFADTLKTSRILSANDSVIHFGENSISISPGTNVISWGLTKSGCGFLIGYNGLAIANGNSFAKGNNSMVFGNNVNVPCGVPNAFVIGNGVTNNIANSFQLGWSGTTIFADATGIGINNLTSHSQTLDVNGTANIRTVTMNNSLTQVLVRDPANLGLIQWRDAATLASPLNAWLLGGNNFLNSNLSFVNNILGTTEPGVHLQLFAGNAQWQFIDANTGFIGLNNGSPNDRLDVNNGDIDVNIPANGYQINDQYVLQHKGDATNIFTGVGAGQNNTGSNNTFVGNNAGFTNPASGNNTFIGKDAGFNNNSDADNTFVGYSAGYWNRGGGPSFQNTFVGSEAGYWLNSPPAPGAQNGQKNTYLGYRAGYGTPNTSHGAQNTCLGWKAGHNLESPDYNTFVGSEAGFNTLGGSPLFGASGNTFLGGLSGFNNIDGNQNVSIGIRAGYTFDLDIHNVFIGAFSDASQANLHNAAAIGANAIVTTNDDMILGDNSMNVGIGLSGVTGGPQNRLEINNSIAGTDLTPVNLSGSTGLSGLRFRDLTSFSTPEPTNSAGTVLSVNLSGDIVLVTDQTSVGGGVGTCIPFAPTTFSAGANGAIDLTNNNNFYFIGNGAGTTVNNVVIGKNCTTPIAKLDILQSSGTPFSIGEKILNTDPDAAGLVVNTGNSPYSVVVPPGGYEGVQLGHQVIIGRDINLLGITGTNAAGALMQVGEFGDGTWIEVESNTYPSDSSLKTNVEEISNALNTIRNIRGVTYNWTTTGRPDIGFIAQELQQEIPLVVRVDSSSGIKSADYARVVPVTVEAIKQLDSALTKATSAPDAPVLISPADGAVGDFRKAIFTWHSISPGIVFYRAQAATDIAFTNIVRDQRGITDTTTSFDLPCDTVSATYYWRVNATNNAGASPFSQVFSFTDTAKCGKTPNPSHDPIRAQQAVSFNSTSDSNFKINIAPVTNALDKVSQLNAVYYNWVHTNPNYEFDSAQQVGFIAQDVQQVIPQVVRADSNGFLTLDYGRVVPVLAEAIKELKAWKDSVSNNSMRTTNNAVPSTEEELASNNAILYQNTPNPFGDGTSIGYFVSENTADAYMVFYDEFGNEIKKSNLPYRGQNAKLNLTTQNLASGIYTYSLVVNGKIADAKKMLKTK